MMGSKRQQSFMDPVPQSKAARLEGDVGAVPLPELSKSTDVPRYSSSQSAQYTGACLSYYLPGQERVDTASQWSRMCIRNSRSPLCHPTFTGASNTSKVVYGPDSAMSLGNSSPTLEKGLMLKQMFASYYSPSPGNCSPNVASLITPVAMKTLGGADHSQKMENPVSLAIPKPVYGPHPCFTELPCSTGPGYGLESRPHGVMPNIFDDEWFGHYGNVSSLHRRDPKGLMQQRELRSEHDAERIPQKEVTAEDCQGMGSAGLNRFSAFSHPSHDCYTCRPSRSGPTPERCQRFQVPTRAYYIPPSHLHNYDPEALSQCGISPEAYQDPTPDSRYMQIPQRNLLYNSRPHFDAESTSACRGVGQKYIEGVPPHQAFAPPFYTNLPLPSHLILRNFAPPHPAYQIHVNGEISTAPPQKYHMSVPNLQVDRPLDYSMQRTKPTFPPKPLHRLHGTPGILQSPFELDNGSFSNRSPVKRPQGPHLNRPAYPTGGCGVSATSGGLPDTPTSKLVICDQSKSKFMKGTFSKCGDCIPGSYMQCEDHGEADEGQTPPSPPMPVINNVFSLAPYKAYLDATGMLPPARQWQNDDHPMTPKQMKQDVVVEKEMKPQMDDLQRALCDNAYTEVKIKSEKMELEEIPCAIRAYMVKNVNTHDGTGTIVKKELGDSVNAESMLGLNIVVKSDCELKSSVLIDAKDPITSECRIQTAVKHDTEPTLTGNCIREDTPPVVSPPPVPTMPPQTSETDFCLQKIPPQALKITNFKMVLPKVLQIPASSTSVEILKSPVETKAAVDCSRQARHHFMELHQSLLRLLHNFMSKRPLQDLRTWLSHLNLGEPVYPPAKSQKISCLVGTGVRAVWFLDQELSAVLLKVLEKLRTYIASGSCPFPHVIRAGAIFVPMLLVKEVLFPQVPGTFIDQVLQEHRVELRPATLSEERHLTQLQKRACSSKLRRLLSLKHLPEVYPDVLNLLYYVSVNKVLGVVCVDLAERRGMDHTEENSGKYPLQCAVIPDYSCLKTLRKKDLSKKACQQNSSHEEEAENVGLVKSLDEETLVIQPEASYIDEKNDLIKIEEEQEINQDPEVPWGGPVSSDELSPENSDTESESTVSYQSPSASSCSKTQVVPKSHSGMILKLRKVFLRKNGRGDKILYQAVSDFSKDADQQKTETLDPTRSRGHRREMHNKRKHERSHPSSRRERRATNVSLDRLQKQSRRSMKYCPYLSTCHRADRRRWVLRSAVQIANSSYPNLVGKRIRHLYEDNDKTEVWYRGVVLRVHEPHPNPLKTVFEVKYDSEPEWQYYLELLMDYKKGWLKVED